MKIKNSHYCLIAIFLILNACVTLQHDAILTSKDESWYIPKNVTFQAKKIPIEELKTYIAEDDLMVLYMGKYLEVERLADACVKKNCL